MTVETVFKTFISAGLIACLLTPVSIVLAKRIGAVRRPRDARGARGMEIPRFGGLAIALASMLIIGYFLGDYPEIPALLVGGSLIFLLGAIDDIRGLPAWGKFLVELAVAVGMYASGIRIGFIDRIVGEGHMVFGSTLCFLVTIFWIVGVTNAINLMDGLDGLTAGVAAIMTICTAYVAYIHGTQYGSVMVGLALTAISGACVGFLPFNYAPAKTFMGDCGSLYLGFMIATLVIISPLKKATVISLVIPLLLLALPIIDTLLSIVRRAIRHQPVMQPDGGHIHYRAFRQEGGQRRAVILLYGITGTMGVSAILMSRELYKESILLFAVVATQIYLLMTSSDGVRLNDEPAEGVDRSTGDAAERESEKGEK